MRKRLHITSDNHVVLSEEELPGFQLVVFDGQTNQPVESREAGLSDREWRSLRSKLATHDLIYDNKELKVTLKERDEASKPPGPAKEQR